MSLDANAVVAAEMERVTPLVRDMYELDDTFYSGISKGTDVEHISSRDMRIPLKIRPGGRFGHYNPNGGGLGRGSAGFFDKAVINTVHLRYACEWTKAAEWSTDTTRKSVVSAFKDIVASAMPQFRNDSDKLCMQPGTGVLGTVSGVTTASGVDTVTLATDGFGAMLLRHGLMVNVYDSTLATNRTAAGETEITEYDSANKTIDLTPAVTGITATDVIVISGLAGANPVSLYGVPYHNSAASTGSWLGLSRVTNPEIRSTEVAAGGALQLPQARQVINKIMNRIGQSKAKNLKLKACMNPANEDLNLYFGENMQIAGSKVQTSIHWDMTRIDFLTDKFWGRAEMKAPGFYDVGGRKFFELRDASGAVASSQLFYIVASWNLYCKNPASAGYISGLTIPAGY